ncbi:Uncharacterised protein [Bordetella pertussis]|nr:Uncharacterised protein [Bordetella pertussis]
MPRAGEWTSLKQCLFIQPEGEYRSSAYDSGPGRLANIGIHAGGA